MTSALDDELRELRDALMSGGRPQLTREQGAEAFERHMLLASRIHRAARLNQRVSDGEGEAWVRYVEDHFPPTRRADAKLLWDDWRTTLLKDESPGGQVAVTHLSPNAHWGRTSNGQLVIDLESMWDDFAASVESFVGSLCADPERRTIALHRFRERVWIVQEFTIASGAPHASSTEAASARGS